MNAARVDELAAAVTALQAQVAEISRQLDLGPSTGIETPLALHFPDVEAWVMGMFLPMFGWRVDGHRWHWCPQWWQHAEAIWRLELLWRSWEASRLVATGMSSWSVELDRHLRELLGEDGPFRQCRMAEQDRAARHTHLAPATAEPAPVGWWD